MSVVTVTDGCWRASCWLDGEHVHGCYDLVSPLGAIEWIERPAPAHIDDFESLEALAAEISGGRLDTWRMVSFVASRGNRRAA